jgi:release factor glutamine methyltransferase
LPPLRDALLAATRTLHGAGVAGADDDARALALHVLDLRHPDELLGVEELAPDRASALDTLVTRRAAREPLEHLTGHVRFRGIGLEVGPGVFVPQPETEAVVAWVIAAAHASGRTSPQVADLCAGAGTIALTLANELPAATVHAVELDPAAFAWTRRNAARRAGAGDTPIHLHLGSVEGCLPGLDGQLDFVVSNPPYVANHEQHVPDPEVIDHVPAVALFAGSDGLDVVRQVELAARRLLRPGGYAVVEHSDRQGRIAPAVFAGTVGWTEVTDHVDQQGRDRYVTARWTGRPNRP